MLMSSFHDCMPAMAMVAVQSIYAAMAICAKAAIEQGMSPTVFVVYRQAVATLFLALATVFSGRGCTARGSIGWAAYCLVFVASLLGVTLNQILYYQGLHLATSSVATAMLNLVPAITFVMAASVGLEKIRFNSMRTLAKVLGTLLCVGGAISMGFFKGPKIINIQQLELVTATSNLTSDKWILGFFCFVGCTCFWSLWLILQVPICKNYLDPLSLSTWMCFLGACQSAVIAFFIVPDHGAWKITSILQLLSCLFAGVFGSGVTFYLQSWTISARGPLFSAVFNPLCTVITTIASVPLLHEEIHIGSLVGSLTVVCGLYIVLWGKVKDLETTMKPEESSSSRGDEEIGSCETDVQEPLLTAKTFQDAEEHQ